GRTERRRNRGARLRPRHRDARAAPALLRGVQAPPGAPRRQDHAKGVWKRSPVSDYQRLSRDIGLWALDSGLWTLEATEATARRATGDGRKLPAGANRSTT